MVYKVNIKPIRMVTEWREIVPLGGEERVGRRAGRVRVGGGRDGGGRGRGQDNQVHSGQAGLQGPGGHEVPGDKD